jgi:hypothetical protein
MADVGGASQEYWSANHLEDEHNVTRMLRTMRLDLAPIGFHRANVSYAIDVLVPSIRLGGNNIKRLLDLLQSTDLPPDSVDNEQIRTAYAMMHAVLTKMMTAKHVADASIAVAEHMGITATMEGLELDMGPYGEAQVYYKGHSTPDLPKFVSASDPPALRQRSKERKFAAILFPEHVGKLATSQLLDLEDALSRGCLRDADLIDLRAFAALFMRWYPTHKRNADYFTDLMSSECMLVDTCVAVPIDDGDPLDTSTSALRSNVLSRSTEALMVATCGGEIRQITSGAGGTQLYCWPGDSAYTPGSPPRRVSFLLKPKRYSARVVELALSNAPRNAIADVQFACMNSGGEYFGAQSAAYPLRDTLARCTSLPHYSASSGTTDGWGFYVLAYAGPPDGAATMGEAPMVHLAIAHGLYAALQAMCHPLRAMVRTVHAQIGTRNSSRTEDVPLELNPNYAHLAPANLLTALAAGMYGSHTDRPRSTMYHIAFGLMQALGVAGDSRKYFQGSARRPDGDWGVVTRGFMYTEAEASGQAASLNFRAPTTSPPGYGPYPASNPGDVIRLMLDAMSMMLFIDIVFAHKGTRTLSQYWSMAPRVARELVDSFGPALQSYGFTERRPQDMLDSARDFAILGEQKDLVVTIFGSAHLGAPIDTDDSRHAVNLLVAAFLVVFDRHQPSLDA